MKTVSPDLDWKGDQVPVSKQFDDPYYSLDNGLHETQHVFLAANGLPDRFKDGFSIAELGFGTGLNFLTTLQLVDGWPDLLRTGKLKTADMNLLLIIGDARETVPQWKGRADCWYLDGFSPAKIPELSETDLLSEVYSHTETEGTAATYTAAGYVRRNLVDAGFKVERAKGYGRKRHMTLALKGSKDEE